MFVALVLLVLSDVPHPALHPADADLYLEVPDMRAALTAYASAPAVQITSSEGASQIAAVAKAVGFDIADLAGSLLPVPDPSRAGDRWWPWSEAQRVSCSLSGIEAGSASSSRQGWILCDFATPEAAAQAELAVIAMGGGGASAIEDLTLGESKVQVREIGVPFEVLATRAWIANTGTRLVIGLGSAKSQDFAKRSQHADGELMPRWVAARAQRPVSPAGSVPVLEILSDMADLPAFAADSPALSAATLLLAPFLGGTGSWRIELRGDRFVTDGVYEPRGAAKEFLGSLGPAPASSDAIRFVPPDSVGAWIGSVDPGRAESAVGALLQGLLGEAPIGAALQGAPRMADGLRSSVAVSLLPLQSLMSPTPRLLMAIDLADAARFQSGLDAWLVRAKAANPGLEIERKPYRKVPTIVLSSASTNDKAESTGVPDSPFGASMLEPTRVTIAVLEDRVILASAPSVARGEIKRIQEKSDAGVHAGLRTVEHPTDAFEFSTLDWSAYLSSVYDGARGFAPMLAQNLDKPIDIDKLPTGAQLFAPVRPSTSWSKSVDGRIQVHAESSFGPETPAALVALGVIGMKAMRSPRSPAAVEDTSTATSTETPAESSSVDAQAQTLDALREVRTAIAVYRSQFGSAPQTTSDLLKKTDAFPDGFLRSGALPQDGWQRELVYSASATDPSYTLYSLGADGIDQQGAGDDVRLP